MQRGCNSKVEVTTAIAFHDLIFDPEACKAVFRPIGVHSVMKMAPSPEAPRPMFTDACRSHFVVRGLELRNNLRADGAVACELLRPQNVTST